MKSGEDPTREALNCVRVLGRVMVVVYENDADGDEVDDSEFYGNETSIPTDAQLRDHFAWNTLWNRNRCDTQEIAPTEAQYQGDTQNESHSATKQKASLAEQLIKCTIDLLFCAGFTIPESVMDQQGDKINVRCEAKIVLQAPDLPTFRSSVCHLGERRRVNAKHWL